MFDWARSMSWGVNCDILIDNIHKATHEVRKAQQNQDAKIKLFETCRRVIKEAIAEINIIEKALDHDTNSENFTTAEKFSHQAETATHELILAIEKTEVAAEFPVDTQWIRDQFQIIKDFHQKIKESRFCNKLVKITVEMAKCKKRNENDHKYHSQLDSLIHHIHDNALLAIVKNDLTRVLIEQVKTPVQPQKIVPTSEKLFLEKVSLVGTDPETLKNVVFIVNTKLQNKIENKDALSKSDTTHKNDKLCRSIVENTILLTGFKHPEKGGRSDFELPAIRLHAFNSINESINEMNDIETLRKAIKMLEAKSLEQQKLPTEVEDKPKLIPKYKKTLHDKAKEISDLLEEKILHLQEDEQLISAFELSEGDPRRLAILNKYRELKRRDVLARIIKFLNKMIRENPLAAHPKVHSYVHELEHRDKQLERAENTHDELKAIILSQELNLVSHKEMIPTLEALFKKENDIVVLTTLLENLKTEFKEVDKNIIHQVKGVIKSRIDELLPDDPVRGTHFH